MSVPLRALLVVVALVTIWVPYASAYCLWTGEYEGSSTPAYSCAYGVVDWSASAWVFEDLGNGQISVTVSPGPLPVLLGSIDCDALTFTATASVHGTCHETYTLTGTILSVTQWSGTFSAAFVGDCADCTLQSWPVNGTHSGCLEPGEYESSPTLAYSCMFGMVNWSVSSWHFQDQGNGSVSVTASPGPLPVLMGSIDCATLTFTATGDVAGACYQVYTLTGDVPFQTAWTGTFTAEYLGGGYCSDCTTQSWPVELSASTGIAESALPTSWGTIKALYGEP